jgi:hypothetical protein
MVSSPGYAEGVTLPARADSTACARTVWRRRRGRGIHEDLTGKVTVKRTATVGNYTLAVSLTSPPRPTNSS